MSRLYDGIPRGRLQVSGLEVGSEGARLRPVLPRDIVEDDDRRLRRRVRNVHHRLSDHPGQLLLLRARPPGPHLHSNDGHWLPSVSGYDSGLNLVWRPPVVNPLGGKRLRRLRLLTCGRGDAYYGATLCDRPPTSPKSVLSGFRASTLWPGWMRSAAGPWRARGWPGGACPLPPPPSP